MGGECDFPLGHRMTIHRKEVLEIFSLIQYIEEYIFVRSLAVPFFLVEKFYLS